jgi:CubicO group peptidase (beta-lactamase class C family)
MTPSLPSLTDRLFAAWDRPDSPGCAVGIIQDGALVYVRGFGRASLEHDLPITGQTVFDIASTSKQFTAACIALLIEDGRLALDDDVRQHIPELPDLGVSVTVAHLLHHTSGWRDYLTLFDLAGYREADYFDEPELLAMLGRQQALNFVPGARYDYSNTGYYLLGVLVERLSGQSPARFAHDHIFTPLGMTRTWFQDDHTRIVPGRSTGYSPAAAGGYRTDMTTLDVVGDGGLLTCVEDLARWDRVFYDNPLGRGGPALIELMTTPGRLADGEPVPYGFGLDLVPYRGLTCISHGGWFVGYRSEMMRFPQQRFTVICLANAGSINPTRLCAQVADLWLAEAMGADAGDPGRDEAVAAGAPAEGLYFDAATGRLIAITTHLGDLAADFGSGPRPLTPIAPGHWRTADDDYDLFPDGDALAVTLYGRPHGAYTSVPPHAPSSAELSAYTGTYVNRELDVAYALYLQDGALWLRYGRVEPVSLHPAQAAVFRQADRTFVFHQDADARPTGFTLSAARAWGFRFDRQPGD